MLDPKCFRQDIHFTAKRLEQVRGFKLDIDTIQALEERRKSLQLKMQALQNIRNTESKQIGQAKARGENIEPLLMKVNQLGDDLQQVQVELEDVQNQLQKIYFMVPNLPHPEVPLGKTEEDNVEIKRWGEPKIFEFEAKEHSDLGEARGLIDFSTAAKITGARFVVLKGKLARLQRALIQFMLDTHTEQHGYQEVYVPYIINTPSLYGTGQLPKFAEEQFRIERAEGDPWYLLPTAEVPVTNIHRDVIVEASELPFKYTAHTPCFRSEAGSYGKDTRGMIRQHQFEKVELVWITRPQDSEQALETMRGHAEAILQKLELPYRVVNLCGGDLGFSATKTYDIEVWLPGQKRYREISSCSNTTDFQARRLQARWRNPETGRVELVHTLNGSGLPAGRTLIAIIENYQDKEGNIHIPSVLYPYMGGIKVI